LSSARQIAWGRVWAGQEADLAEHVGLGQTTFGRPDHTRRVFDAFHADCDGPVDSSGSMRVRGHFVVSKLDRGGVRVACTCFIGVVNVPLATTADFLTVTADQAQMVVAIQQAFCRSQPRAARDAALPQEAPRTAI
jgi:hypothetical protein